MAKQHIAPSKYTLALLYNAASQGIILRVGEELLLCSS